MTTEEIIVTIVASIALGIPALFGIVYLAGIFVEFVDALFGISEKKQNKERAKKDVLSQNIDILSKYIEIHSYNVSLDQGMSEINAKMEELSDFINHLFILLKNYEILDKKSLAEKITQIVSSARQKCLEMHKQVVGSPHNLLINAPTEQDKQLLMEMNFTITNATNEITMLILANASFKETNETIAASKISKLTKKEKLVSLLKKSGSQLVWAVIAEALAIIGMVIMKWLKII